MTRPAREYRPEDALAPLSRMFKWAPTTQQPNGAAASWRTTGAAASATSAAGAGGLSPAHLPRRRRASDGDLPALALTMQEGQAAVVAAGRTHFFGTGGTPRGVRPRCPRRRLRPRSAHRAPLSSHFASRRCGSEDDREDDDDDEVDDEQEDEEDDEAEAAGTRLRRPRWPPRPSDPSCGQGPAAGTAASSWIDLDGSHAAVLAAQQARSRARRTAARRRWGLVVDALSERLSGAAT